MQAEQRLIAIGDLVLSDRRYQITRPENTDRIASAIRGAGLINPPVVQAGQHGYILVAGFGRAAACLNLQWRHIPCRVLAGTTSPLDCLKIAVADNALTRQFNLAEQCRAVAKLREFCENARSLSALLEPLGLFIAPPLVEKLFRLSEMPEIVQEAAAQNHISLNTALSLESIDRTSAEAMAGLFKSLRPTVNQQQEIFSGLHDLARLEEISIDRLLKIPEFADILDSADLDRGLKLQRLRTAIRRRRYPALSRVEDAFYRRRRSLEMEAGMDLKLPANFEDTTFTMVMRFSSTRQLCGQAECLGRICEHPELKAILNKEIEDSQDLY
ncbi:MAG: ParB/RepB/Spo0J family partition protein [Desulfobacterales bacterium]